MLVSLIIVAYNAEKHLSSILENIIEQNYDHKNIEIILVDSCSTDSTITMMKEFKKDELRNFKRIVVLENPKKTLPCGWNVALKKSNGDIIIRIDAHAIIQSNFISLNVETIKKGENICGGTVTSIIGNNENKFQKTLLIAENSIFGGGTAKFRRNTKESYVNTVAYAAYKRCVFIKVGGYNELLARTEDNEMHYRMKLSGEKFYFNPTIKTKRVSRNTLLQLLKQKYLNGFWIGKTMYVSPKCFSLYHFVPLIFFLSIIVAIVAYFLDFSLLIVAIAVSYFLTSLIFTIMHMLNKFLLTNFMLPIIFFLFHFCYGLGTFIGLVIGLFEKKLKSECPEINNVKIILEKK